jgi:hypothetical protein
MARNWKAMSVFCVIDLLFSDILQSAKFGMITLGVGLILIIILSLL